MEQHTKTGNLPTAEEFCKENYLSSPKNIAVAKTGRKDGKIKYTMEDAMIDFAKLHVKAALEAAKNNARTKFNNSYLTGTPTMWDISIDKESILNAYPEDLIV